MLCIELSMDLQAHSQFPFAQQLVANRLLAILGTLPSFFLSFSLDLILQLFAEGDMGLFGDLSLQQSPVRE